MKQVGEFVKKNYEVAVSERWKTKLVPAAIKSLEFMVDNQAEIGTSTHENMLLDENERSEFAKTTDEVVNSIRGWEKFVEYFGPFKIVSNEQSLIGESEFGKYGGTFDLLIKKNNRYILMDIKTSNNVYPTHALQVAAYTKAYNQSYLTCKCKEIKEAWILQLFKYSKEGEFDIFKVNIDKANTLFDSLLYIHDNLTNTVFKDDYMTYGY